MSSIRDIDNAGEAQAEAENPQADAPRTRPNFPSDEKRRHAAILFKHGIGYCLAAQILGVNQNTVRDWSRNWLKGRFREELSPRLFPFSEDTRRLCIELRRAGASWNAISKETEVPASTIRRWLRKTNEATAEGEEAD